jgi:hypothetical protein
MVIAVAATSTAAMAQEGAAVPASAMNQLRGAPAGVYRLAPGGRQPLPANEATPIQVQVDVCQPANGAERVPLVIGADTPVPSTIEVRFEPGTRPGVPVSSARRPLIQIPNISGRVHESREVSLQPGPYDIVAIVARRERDGSVIGTVVRESIDIPDLSGDRLAATPIVLGSAVVAAEPGQGVRPFVFGQSHVVPAGLKRFRQSEDLHIAFRVQGWAATAVGPARPDLEVEYVFQQQVGNGLRFFNKTRPQVLNDRTLAKSFTAENRLLASGMTVPLAAFPPGEFSVIVRVRDKRTQALTIQQTRFVVQP